MLLRSNTLLQSSLHTKHQCNMPNLAANETDGGAKEHAKMQQVLVQC